MRPAIYLLLVAILATSAFYVSYSIGYRIAPKLNNRGYMPQGMKTHEISVRDFKPDFYPSSINL